MGTTLGFNHQAFNPSGESAAFGRRMGALSTDKVFAEFLLATGRIYGRRKEDIQTRRVGDTTEASVFTRKAVAVGGIVGCRVLVNEFDAWRRANGKHEDRRQ